MNVPNLLALAARLRSPSAQQHFDLRLLLDLKTPSSTRAESIHDCGSVACIAGFACVLADPTASAEYSGGILAEAGKWLGLEYPTYLKLFDPAGTVVFSKITATIAADVVTHLANTGEVVWPKSVQK